MLYTVFDVETTGLAKVRGPKRAPCSLSDNGDEVIQIGGLFLDDGFNPVRAFCHYCDCLLPESDPKALMVHGIRMEDVRSYVLGIFLEDVILDCLPEFLLNDITFIGYNVGFDLFMVEQGLRSSGVQWIAPKSITGRLYKTGRRSLDALAYLPKRTKLSSFETTLKPERERFWQEHCGIPIESNAMELFEQSWSHAHNSLYDSLETYCLLKSQILGKKIIVGHT